MMKFINTILIFVSFVFSLASYQILPEMVPMHWNIRGEIDNYMPKSQAIWFFPILVTVIWIGFKIFPRLDPKKEKYKLFKKEWLIIQTGLLGFFVYLQVVVFYIGTDPAKNLLPLMFIGFGVLFILLGNYLSKIRQNYFIGIKLPWTLADEDNWNKTHRFASWCFVIIGIITLIEAYAIWYAPVVIFGGIFLAVLLPTIYSFLVYKKSVDKMKYVYVALLAMALIVFGIRLISGEDDWICKNGKWIKHGVPSAPQPQEDCR
jgi:uncharacterized membrane protein